MNTRGPIVLKAETDLVFSEIQNRSEWDDLFARSRYATPFMERSFLDVLPCRVRLFGAYTGGRLVGGACILVDPATKKPLFKMPTRYQSLLIDDTTSTGRYAQQRDFFWVSNCLIAGVSREYPEFGWMLPPDWQDCRSFLWHNYGQPAAGQFECRPYYVGWVTRSLSNESGMEVREDCPWHVLREFWSDQQNWMDPIIQYIQMKKKGFCGVLFEKKEPTAALLYLTDAKVAYWVEETNRGAIDLLANAAVSKLFARGLHKVDLGPLGAPGSDDYRLSFRPVPKLGFWMQRRMAG